MSRSIFAASLSALLVLACGTSSNTTTSSGASSSGSAQPACELKDASSCGTSVCVAHSEGNRAGCEEPGNDGDLYVTLGCQACRTEEDCSLSSGGGCIDGSCRQKIGYPWRKGEGITVDDATLAARCCPTSRMECKASSDGIGCTCL